MKVLQTTMPSLKCGIDAQRDKQTVSHQQKIQTLTVYKLMALNGIMLYFP
jgi:hypothetical protein